jgi:uncharacterized protein YbaR (Trm112 family)
MSLDSRLLETGLLVCTRCRNRLTLQADPDWLTDVVAGRNTEAAPTRPAGAVAEAPSAGLVCTNGECRHVYLVWDEIPNMLVQEAAVLKAGERGA